MATLNQIKRFEEGMDLLGSAQIDAKKILSTSTTSNNATADIKNGWNDLNLCVPKEEEYTDLFTDPYSIAKGFLSKLISDAESYLQTLAIQVPAPNWYPGKVDQNGNLCPQFINLYAGTATSDGNDGFDQDFKDYTFNDDGYEIPVSANFWEVMKDSTISLMNDSNDAYWNNTSHATGLGCNWGSDWGFAWFDESDKQSSGDADGMCSTAVGSLDQWAPYINISGGDSSTLNSDAFLN